MAMCRVPAEHPGRQASSIRAMAAWSFLRSWRYSKLTMAGGGVAAGGGRGWQSVWAGCAKDKSRVRMSELV